MLIATVMTVLPLTILTVLWAFPGEGFVLGPFLSVPLIPAGALGIVSVVLAHRSLWVGQPRPRTVALVILATVGAFAAGFAIEGWIYG